MEMSYKEYLQDITTFIFDVDGVLTDGSILVTTSGEQLRKMNIKDGFALKLAVEKGYNVCIISGGSNEGVKERLRGLGITDIYMGTRFKEEPFEEYLDIYNIAPENVLFMGDDLPDIPVMLQVALPACPQDASPEVKAISKYVSHKHGGQGCVRDVIEQVMKVRGDWEGLANAQND